MDKYILTIEEQNFLGYFIDPSSRNYTTNSHPTQVNIYCLDCEFVETTIGEEIAIVAIANPNTNQNYVIKVKPLNPIINWIGHITGLDSNTQWDMEFDELIEFLQILLNKDDILIGHHMYNDLKKLNWYHPNIIDTCLLFHTQDGPPSYYSLKQLALIYLKKIIQLQIHSALEDAKTAYELVEYYLINKYNKINWEIINGTLNLDKINIFDLIVNLIKIDHKKLYCIYTKGFRANGINKFDDDLELVVICDKSANIINGFFVKYQSANTNDNVNVNVNIYIYDKEEFEKYLEFQYIWALECLYCPKNLIYLELIDFRQIVENYRISNIILSNDYLNRSVCYESGRKLASGKKHYLIGNYYQAKKHIFIAFKFMDYSIQIVNHNKINNIRNSNFIWYWFMTNKTDGNYEQFKLKWFNMYKSTNRIFSKLIGKNTTLNQNYKLYNHISFHRNFNFDLFIIKLITTNKINNFLSECPNHLPTYNRIIDLYGEFKLKIVAIYNEIIMKNQIKGKKDFYEILNNYTKNFHKYLYLLYEKKSIQLENLKFKSNKIYNDIIIKKTNNLTKSNYKSNYKPIPKKEWIEYQNINACKIITTDFIDPNNIRYIGGLDISFDKNDDSKACGYLTIFDITTNQIVWEEYKKCILDIPYVSGFLGFREIDVYKELVGRLVNNPVYPQILFIDGFGILHHREFGSACQIGLELDIPTVGIAKTLLYHDGLDEFQIKNKFRSQCIYKGDSINLVGKSGKIFGVALRTSTDAINPIYVSIGHKISLGTSIDLVIKTCLFKNPEPIRNSDVKSKLYL